MILKCMHVCFCYFRPAPTYCISVTVAQQRRHDMSQHIQNWHRGEQWVLRCHKLSSLTGDVHARHPHMCVRHTLEYWKCNHDTHILWTVEEESNPRQQGRGNKEGMSESSLRVLLCDMVKGPGGGDSFFGYTVASLQGEINIFWFHLLAAFYVVHLHFTVSILTLK